MKKGKFIVLSLMALMIWIIPFGGLSAQAYFTNVTDEAGLTDVTAFRLSIADLNGDNYPDILLHKQTRAMENPPDVLNKQFLYLNVPGDDPNDPYSRKFIDYTEASGIRANREGTPDGRHSDLAVFADVDNDGDLDIFTGVYVHRNYTLNQGTNELLINDGHAHFVLAPNSPFHTEPIYNTAGAVFVDYNNDANIDLFIGNWYWNNVLSVDQLYRGYGDGSFVNVTSEAGIDAASTAVYAVAAWDWNDDGFVDLFAPSYSRSAAGAESIHWRNNGDGTFTQVQDITNYSAYTGYGAVVCSFGSMPRDFDHDGDIDFLEIFTHGYGDGAGGIHSTAVENDNGIFSWDFYRVDNRATEDPNMSHHGDHYASWFDYDNDGLSDFAITECGYGNNRIYLFRHLADHTFNPVTVASGLNQINIDDLPSHNVMPFDYDLDGDEDLLVGFANDVDSIQLWRNEVGTQNNWITITLEGAGLPGYSNKSAIGARVELNAGGETYTREVHAGNGQFSPQVPLSMTFGLDQAALVDSIIVYWPNENQTSLELNDIGVNQFFTIHELSSPVECDIDLVSNTHTCQDIEAITFVQEPSDGKVVLKANLDPNYYGHNRAIFDVEYGSTPEGWTVNIGDSATNNGAGGDSATQSNDAELHIYRNTMSVYGKDGTPANPLETVADLVDLGSLVSLEVSNKRLAWDNYVGASDRLLSPYLYSLNGQPDSEGPVNYEIYAAFNRVIGSALRTGTGVTNVHVKLVFAPDVCKLDLEENTHTCEDIEAISFVVEPSDGEAVLKTNLDPNDSGYNKAVFDVQYGEIPTGWNANIGDSSTNNGAGGDAGTQSNDAELHIQGTTMKVYGKDGTPSNPLEVVDDFVNSHFLATLEVENEHLLWDNHSGEADDLISPYLYALNGQPDSEGPVNYDIFAAFNRVIWTTSRFGTGVNDVTVNLLNEPTVFEINLTTNTHTGQDIEGVTFIQEPDDGEVVFKINLDPNESGYNKAVFEIEYGAAPSGWTVNIGDSATNNGAGGDSGTQSNDAELHIHNASMQVFGKDGSPYNPLKTLNDFVGEGSRLVLEVSNERLTWNNHVDEANDLISSYLYALNGQPDSEGPVNYDIYAAFNRVILYNLRNGTGVTHVTVKLLYEPLTSDFKIPDKEMEIEMEIED